MFESFMHADFILDTMKFIPEVALDTDIRTAPTEGLCGTAVECSNRSPAVIPKLRNKALLARVTNSTRNYSSLPRFGTR